MLVNECFQKNQPFTQTGLISKAAKPEYNCAEQEG